MFSGMGTASPNVPGNEPSQATPQPESQGGWEAVRRMLFQPGSQERMDAVDTIKQGVDAFAGGGMASGAAPAGRAAVAGARAVPGLLRRGMNWAAEHPRTVAAAAGAIPGAVHGNTESALGGAVAGAVLAGRGGLSAPKAAPVAAKAASSAAKVDGGRAASAAHSKLVAFAKETAARNPKVGEKIWMLLDDAGIPIRNLTPDQAGAAARKGLKTTWVKNLWRASGL